MCPPGSDRGHGGRPGTRRLLGGGRRWRGQPWGQKCLEREENETAGKEQEEETQVRKTVRPVSPTRPPGKDASFPARPCQAAKPGCQA